METKEQLEQHMKKKWRKIQATQILGALVLGTYGYFGKLPIAAIFASILLVMSLLDEFVIVNIPSMTADEMREQLKRKR